MSPEEKAAFINSQVACALIEAEGMKAENTHRLDCGKSIAYGEEAFDALPAKFGIQHNDVIAFLRG